MDANSSVPPPHPQVALFQDCPSIAAPVKFDHLIKHSSMAVGGMLFCHAGVEGPIVFVEQLQFISLCCLKGIYKGGLKRP